MPTGRWPPPGEGLLAVRDLLPVGFAIAVGVLVAAAVRHTDLPAPEGMSEGIRFEHVTFRYLGATRSALEDVNLFLPAGSVIAVVGENGAGKCFELIRTGSCFTSGPGAFRRPAGAA